ncbi:MAG: hypothetical protein WBN41_04870 [Lysobacterales bacterium]
MNSVERNARRGRVRTILWVLLGLFFVSLTYCSLATPPASIHFDYPHAEEDPQLTKSFWKYYQQQNTSIVANTDCGENLAHPIPNAPFSAETLKQKRRNSSHDPATNSHSEMDLICKFEEYVHGNPKDPQATAILSAMYMWRAQKGVEPVAIDVDLYEAQFHAKQAVDAGNDLASGFWASPTMLLGYITDNDDYKKSAYEALVEHSLEFASFHGYIEGAVLSGVLTPDHKDYKWAAVSFMENLETCFFGNKLRGVIQLPQDMKINNLVMNAIATIARVTGRPWCYNNDAAPFNIEGLYLSQGDAYAKEGKFELARIAYQNAIDSPNSENWHYIDHTRYRLANMEKMTPPWVRDSGKFPVPQDPPPMIFQAEWYCASCHQHATNYPNL